jgi:hypothetical protein
LRERRLTRGACAGPDSDDSDGSRLGRLGRVPTRTGRTGLRAEAAPRKPGWRRMGGKGLMGGGGRSETDAEGPAVRVLAHPTCPSLSESSRASVFSYGTPGPPVDPAPAGRPAGHARSGREMPGPKRNLILRASRKRDVIFRVSRYSACSGVSPTGCLAEIGEQQRNNKGDSDVSGLCHSDIKLWLRTRARTVPSAECAGTGTGAVLTRSSHQQAHADCLPADRLCILPASTEMIQ